ncbi:MAG: hypothetical protein ONB44_23025 [candidate division KSB1 bacterium]|nr:hypothetical protein [candidate division KSB1 bacterium]MDZ7305013.1 hypothetical protein [candidate division KSB1 bacterium]MDZ7314142.1 hypothetical protein [candidate division KSB1 bacterium]
MQEDEILAGLEKLVESLNIQLRYEKGDFAGGYCAFKDKRMMIVNSALSPAQRINILAGELAGMNLDQIFVLPALRKVIMEKAMSRDELTKVVADEGQ